ncbi:MAG: hypothetical protein Tsb0015_08390 [Simkaniaceae bacterium]
MKTYPRILIAVLFLFSITHIYGFDFHIAKQYLPKNPIILDCGANNGASSFMLLKQFPRGKILAVEADPEVFQALQEKTKNHKNIFCFNYALGDRNAMVDFYENADKSSYHSQGSVFEVSDSNWYWEDIEVKKQPILVEMKTLDSLCQEQGIQKIDMMWLDMQGAELMMLSHAKKILPNVKVIYTEVNFEPIYHDIPLYPDVKKFLEKEGFKEVKLVKRHKSWGDALFVRK